MTQTTDQQLHVAAIEEGTVIDHIQANKAIFLLRLLRLEEKKKKVTVGLNLPSGKMGYKDIIKIEGWELNPKEAAQLSLFSPNATVNIIRNFIVAEKYTVTHPTEIDDFVICPNANCITNHEAVKRLFFVTATKKEIVLRCKYCEKSFTRAEIKDFEL